MADIDYKKYQYKVIKNTFGDKLPNIDEFHIKRTKADRIEKGWLSIDTSNKFLVEDVQKLDSVLIASLFQTL